MRRILDPSPRKDTESRSHRLHSRDLHCPPSSPNTQRRPPTPPTCTCAFGGRRSCDCGHVTSQHSDSGRQADVGLSVLLLLPGDFSRVYARKQWGRKQERLHQVRLKAGNSGCGNRTVLPQGHGPAALSRLRAAGAVGLTAGWSRRHICGMRMR